MKLISSYNKTLAVIIKSQSLIMTVKVLCN